MMYDSEDEVYFILDGDYVISILFSSSMREIMSLILHG